MATEYRCKRCGHWPEEHTKEGGCAGCDNGGQPLEVIDHEYEPDLNEPYVPDEE